MIPKIIEFIVIYLLQIDNVLVEYKQLLNEKQLLSECTILQCISFTYHFLIYSFSYLSQMVYEIEVSYCKMVDGTSQCIALETIIDRSSVEGSILRCIDLYLSLPHSILLIF